MALGFPSLPFLLCQVVATLFLFFVTSHADTTVRLGSTIYANYDNNTWSSSSGDFAFGFQKYPGQADQFLLVIWFAKIPDRTIVWSAGDAGGPVAAPTGSKLELTTDGMLMLTFPGGGEIWSSKNKSFHASQAVMLDSGNFVIQGNSSNITIWESFKNPTNTLLPTQVLNVGDKLSSGQILGSTFYRGKFELLLRPWEMVFRQVEPETGHLYEEYHTLPNVTQLIFNSTGDIYTKGLDTSTDKFVPGSFPRSESFCHAPAPKTVGP